MDAEKAGNEEDTDHQDDHQTEDDPLETRSASAVSSVATITPQIFISGRSGMAHVPARQ